MLDPRCTCADPECPICGPAMLAEAEKRHYTPWQPRPGTMPDMAQMGEIAEANVRWERWQTIRRYLLVLLLTGLGSMIGSAITILTFLAYN